MLKVTAEGFRKSLTEEEDSLFCDIFNHLSSDDLELSRQIAEKIMNDIDDSKKYNKPTMWIVAMAFCIDMMFEYMDNVIKMSGEPV